MPRNASRHAAVIALADGLHAAAIQLLRRVRREDVVSGLSPARLSALSVVVFGGPMRISALARAEQVRTATMTPIVAALEADGLVSREPDPTDARAAILRATAKGATLMAEGRARRVATLAADLRATSAADRATLERAVRILRRALAKP